MLQDNRTNLVAEPYIFISCSLKDAENVSNDIKMMVSSGFKIKFNSFATGADQDEKIFNDIKNSKQFVVFLSDAFGSDAKLKKQIDFALSHKVPIVIVYINNVVLNGYYEILFSSISSVEKYSLSYNDYYRRLEAILECECKNIVSHGPSENKRNNFVLHIDYEHSEQESVDDLDKTKQIVTTSFRDTYTLQNEEIKSEKTEKKSKYVKPLLIIVSAVVLVVIVIFAAVLIRNKLSSQNYKTGLDYYNGVTMQQNYDQAYKYFLKAANEGNINAMYYIGKMYQNGQSVTKDNVKAFNWYTKSAEKGNSLAEQNLGDMLYSGIGVSQDYSKAYTWYIKAAKQNNIAADEKLGEMYLKGYGVPKNYINSAKYFTLSANKGNAYSEFNLGYFYENGYGVTQDYKTAIQWYTKAANQNLTDSMVNLGNIYENGRGVPQDYTQAFNWFTKAANKNSAVAECSLGDLYYSGNGVKKDNKLAANWYVKACIDGSKDAPDKLKTMNLGGSSFSYKNLGYMYYNGWGMKKDLTKAKKYFQLAANAGDQDSKDMLKTGKFS
jgi:TPR repeat protein